MSNDLIIQQIKKLKKEGKTIVVAGVGSGLTAKAANNGGADIIATYGTAAYRIQGLPTGLAFLPYDDCNEVTFKLVPEVRASAGNTPVILGLGAHDPRKNIDNILDRLEASGVCGVTNEPFIGMYEGDIKRQMEAVGLGFSREVELIAKAVKRGLLTMAYVFTSQEAQQMVDAGAHIICAMVGGVTSGGNAGGANTVSLDSAIDLINEIVYVVDKENQEIPVLCHGGPLNDSYSVERVINCTGASGYVTGSTGERIPVENAVCKAIESFKNIKRGNPDE